MVFVLVYNLLRPPTCLFRMSSNKGHIRPKKLKTRCGTRFRRMSVSATPLTTVSELCRPYQEMTRSLELVLRIIDLFHICCHIFTFCVSSLHTIFFLLNLVQNFSLYMIFSIVPSYMYIWFQLSVSIFS